MACWTTINHFTALDLFRDWDLIARQNIRMRTKGSCLNPTRSGSNTWSATSITPSKLVFLCLLNYPLAGLHWSRCSDFRNPCRQEEWYPPFRRGDWSLNTADFVLKLKTMWWKFQHSTMIHLSWLIVLTGSAWEVKQSDTMNIVPLRAIVGLAPLVQNNAASDRIDSVWLDNCHVGLVTY